MLNYYVDLGSGFIFVQNTSFVWALILGLLGTFLFFFRFIKNLPKKLNYNFSKQGRECSSRKFGRYFLPLLKERGYFFKEKDGLLVRLNERKNWLYKLLFLENTPVCILGDTEELHDKISGYPGDLKERILKIRDKI